MYSNNTLQIGGNADIYGSVYSTNELTFSQNGGGNGTIYGSAYSATDISSDSAEHITDQPLDNVTPIPPPELKFDVYRSEAVSEGTYYDDDVAAENAIDVGMATSGHFYVEDPDGDETKISKNGTVINGSIAVDGGLNVKGGTYYADADHVAIAVNGDLRFTGNATISGTV